MRRLISILVAALTFLAATAQVQLKVKTNDGAVSTYNGFYEMEFNDSAKTVDLYADSAATLSMDQIESIRFSRDYLPWNLSWKANDNSRHYMFGYGAIMHVRDVMTEDMTCTQAGFDQFSNWAKNMYQGTAFVYSNYVWGYLRDMVLESNQWIAACKGQDALKGLLGIAYASRALLYLDMARMYEFQPNDRTNPISTSGQNVTGLTVPIITEETEFDEQTGYYYAPRATRQEMAKFISDDLDLAEKLIPELDIDSHLLPHLDVVYGLKARLYLWIGDYKNAQRYARLAIETTTTKPMNREQMLSATTGFNDPTCWMWGVQYFPEDNAVKTSIINWTSWVSNQITFGYTGTSTNMYLCIDKKMYERIPDTDVRKLLWISPDNNALNEQIPSVITGASTPINQFLPGYASIKFRPGQGNADNYMIGALSAFPLMRVEEMFFIEAEAAAQQGDLQLAQQLTNQFMKQYRNPSYAFPASGQQATIEEIVMQKRVELWGEGQTFFDVKRLNLSVTRDYEESNFPPDCRFNTEGRPAWMNFVFPALEEKYNAALNEVNNPDPSDVYLANYKPANADSIKNHIHSNTVLDIPKFIDKLEVLPLDSVEQILFSFTPPENDGNVTFESQLQVSLTPTFPQDQTKILSTATGVSGTKQVNIYCTSLSNILAWLLKQQGKPSGGEANIYLRVKSYVTASPTIQYASNTVSFRVKVSDIPGFYFGYSYAPRITANNVDVLDMEKLAGQENVKVCSLNMEGEGRVYTAYDTDFPYRLNLNLWGLGFDVNANGIANPQNLYYDPFVSIYKMNWGEQFTGHPAEYPGLQHYNANITCRTERDDLIIPIKSNPIDVSVIVNHQAWIEYDYHWTDSRSTVMKSEMMPDITQVSYEKAQGENIYRLQAPYATGHNLLLYVEENNAVTMPRQYAYNDALGQTVYVSGQGTFDGYTFDMQITFSNADNTQSIVHHEIYGEKPGWTKLYTGIFFAELFNYYDYGIIYKSLNEEGLYKLVPFIYNEEGFVFTWNKEDNTLSFSDQPTGYNHSEYGMIMACDYTGGHVEDGENGLIFHFYIKYCVDAGTFGAFDDTFTVTNVATNRVKAKDVPTPPQNKKIKLESQLLKLEE